MPPRLFVPTPILAATEFALGDAATRHTQVLRLQPDDTVTLFDGSGGEWSARVVSMGKRETRVQPLAHRPIERELPLAVTLALAMPAGDRMDFVVEKATELGAAAVQPLIAERSVLRLSGERAERRRAHWQAIAVAACEQSGRNRVPTLHPPRPLATWLGSLEAAAPPRPARWLLGWHEPQALREAVAAAPALQACTVLSGPEGGLTADEEAWARARGFAAVSLGPRTLRADTAPLALLAALAVAF